MLTPHAYVVEYRVADACSPPDCKIDGKSAFGRVTGEPAGGYVAVGTDKDELFAKRGVVVLASKAISFTLPRLSRGSLFDASLLAIQPGPFAATLEVRQGESIVMSRRFEGSTAAFEHHTDPHDLGREENFFSHVREPLPESEGPVTFTLKNEGTMSLGCGAPLVLRLVEGRAPRQAVLVFFDAVPYPVFEALYHGEAPTTSWLADWAKRGTLFPQAISPGQLTGSFVRRFFRGDYYDLSGDPSLADQGFDPAPPARAPGPVARLAEQGFFTEAIASNLYLSPLLSRIGFDADYNIESTLELQIHPRVLAARFAREIEIHGEDDALFVVWFANTHAPWRDGRDGASLRPPDADELDLGVLDPIWKNLLDSVDALRDIVDSAGAHANTERVWIIGADHGHTFTRTSRARPWRLTHEAVPEGHMHCCLATAQEARTFLAILPDAKSPSKEGRTFDDAVSTLGVWREVERRLDVDLGLPRTSAFSLPGADDPAPFDDGLVVSVGNSGALFGRHGDLSYHAYQPAPRLGPAWELGPKMSRLLLGSPEPTEEILSEELYDVAHDPREKIDVAGARFGDLVDMRRRMADWLAEYGDGPDAERYEYELDFSDRAELSIRAPREFSMRIDDQAMKSSAPSATIVVTSLRLRDGERPLGVVDLGGSALRPHLVVRCASSGLPLAMLDEAHPRMNLAVARTNCIGAPPDARRPPAGEAFFRAELVSQKRSRADATSVAVPELRRALQRWGYVRDK
jgi:hypothetical protein